MPWMKTGSEVSKAYPIGTWSSEQRREGIPVARVVATHRQLPDLRPRKHGGATRGAGRCDSELARHVAHPVLEHELHALIDADPDDRVADEGWDGACTRARLE